MIIKLSSFRNNWIICIRMFQLFPKKKKQLKCFPYNRIKFRHDYVRKGHHQFSQENWHNISSYMVANMDANMVANMAANMVANMVANKASYMAAV